MEKKGRKSSEIANLDGYPCVVDDIIIVGGDFVILLAFVQLENAHETNDVG